MTDYWVEIGAPYTKDGKECHPYVIMGQSGEVMKGERAGSREEVEKLAQAICTKLTAQISGKRPNRFVINGEYKTHPFQAKGK